MKDNSYFFLSWGHLKSFSDRGVGITSKKIEFFGGLDIFQGDWNFFCKDDCTFNVPTFFSAGLGDFSDEMKLFPRFLSEVVNVFLAGLKAFLWG